jgi:rRNA-processing protein FCF1
MSDISAELAKVQVQGKQLAIKSESPRTALRDSIFARISYVTERLTSAEQQLRGSRQRVAGLTKLSDSLRATLETTISNYEATIASQKTTLDDLNAQLQKLSAENADLAVAKAALSDTVRTLAQENNTVYYVVGTKDELLKRGIIREEGGSRVLFIFGKAGKTIVPARDLEVSEFTPIDKHQVTEIQLPQDAEYRLASQQNLDALATPPDPHGRIKGRVLKIAEPDKFWVGSKFLIIVRG